MDCTEARAMTERTLFRAHRARRGRGGTRTRIGLAVMAVARALWLGLAPRVHVNTLEQRPHPRRGLVSWLPIWLEHNRRIEGVPGGEATGWVVW